MTCHEEATCLEEEQLRARNPVTGGTAAKGGLHLHLHSVLQLTGLHLWQAVVIILKRGLSFCDRLVILQSQRFVFTFCPKEALQCHEP